MTILHEEIIITAKSHKILAGLLKREGDAEKRFGW
jgi:hypothetical protein